MSSMGYIDTLVISTLPFLGRRAVHYTYMQQKKPLSLFAVCFAKTVACSVSQTGNLDSLPAAWVFDCCVPSSEPEEGCR